MSSKKNSLLSFISESHEVFNGNMSIKDKELDAVVKMPGKDEYYSELEDVKKRIYSRKMNKSIKTMDTWYRAMAIIFALFFSAVLILTVSFMPETGNLNNPANNEVAERYNESALKETGATNVVAGMILDYRAFDTLGESHVLFVAAITVTILLRLDKKKRDPEDTKITETIDEAVKEDTVFEPKNDTILQTVSKILVPIIMVFGIYVVLNGHLSPGGGFSGGSIIGAALIMYLCAFGFEKTEKFFNEKVYKTITFLGLAFYALAKCYAFFCGANELNSHISKGIAGHIISAGLILPLDIAVGCVVACTMYAFFAMFRKGGL